jgi:hypothetical protein
MRETFVDARFEVGIVLSRVLPHPNSVRVLQVESAGKYPRYHLSPQLHMPDLIPLTKNMIPAVVKTGGIIPY